MKKVMIVVLVVLVALSVLVSWRYVRKNSLDRKGRINQSSQAVEEKPVSKSNPGTSCVIDGATSATYAYKSVPGVEADLLSLDVYIPKTTQPCAEKFPLLVYVHGGGWQIGDKAGQIKSKATYFPENGYVFISVNYRLAPTVMYPVFNQDVAEAVKYVYDNAERFGADNNRITLMGHSAGGGIISAVSTNEDYLGDVGLPLSTLKCAISIDTEGYDVSKKAAENIKVYQPAFGSDETVWYEASPINHISADKGIPAFFIVTRGNKQRVNGANDFKNKLSGAGIYAEIIETPKLDHEEVNSAIGADSLVTPNLQSFLDKNCK